jgi:hypothetical protein
VPDIAVAQRRQLRGDHLDVPTLSQSASSVLGRTHLLTVAKFHELSLDLPATARFAIVKHA